MTPNPASLALVAGSFIITGYALYAAGVGLLIHRRWDLTSGSEAQLALERKTYLVSTLMAYLLIFELFSLFMFIYTADHNHRLFVGAMCAAGSLNVNAYGYPTLVLKILSFVLCGIWLVLNHTDNRAPDYPLIRPKYRFLAIVAVSLTIETLLQAGYFINLKADVITSCCGTLFSENAKTVAGEIAALPPKFTLVLFFLSMVLTLRIGFHLLVTGKASTLYAYASGLMLVIALVATISVLSVYFYELPTHHCPFCLLQKEYFFVGYFLYLALALGSVPGMSIAALERFKEIASLTSIIPSIQRRLTLISMAGFTLFTLIVLYPMVFSDFRLFGY
jgi:hypothetical protein